MAQPRAPSRGTMKPEGEDAPSVDGRRRVVVDAIRPQVDGYRHPVKRVVGDTLIVEADLLADGHDRLGGVLLFRPRGAPQWREVRLEPVRAPAARRPALGGHAVRAQEVDPPPSRPSNDCWWAGFTLDALGTWEYTVCAWVDAWATWAWGLRRKVEARQDIEL